MLVQCGDVADVPRDIEEEVATLMLASMGTRIDSLSAELAGMA